MNIWLVIIVGGILTFAIRLSFIYLMGRVDVPDGMGRALRYVPPAVLSAILVPELLMHTGRLDFGPGNVRWIAGLIAIATAWFTKSTLITILVGLAVLVLLQFVF